MGLRLQVWKPVTLAADRNHIHPQAVFALIGGQQVHGVLFQRHTPVDSHFPSGGKLTKSGVLPVYRGKIQSVSLFLSSIDKDPLQGRQSFLPFHTSSWKSPTWYYNGFGPWSENVGSYYGSAFSRDCARGIMTLAEAGYSKDMLKVMERFNEWLMFFPRNYPKLQLDSKPIPGHWTVVPNMPLIYSEELVHVGWPTRYTQERFGSHYKDFGNPENDGHGLLMMANWKVWQKNGKPVRWVMDSWEYLREAAEYILWAIENSP